MKQAPSYVDPTMMEQQAEYERAARYAEMLRKQQQGFADGPAGQMVSGHYVPTFNGLKSFAAAIGASNAEDRASDRQKALASALQSKRDSWMAEMPQSTPNTSEAGPVVPQNPTAEDYLSWGMKGMAIDPNAAQLGMRFADSIEARQARADERVAADKRRAAEIEGNQAFQRSIREEADARAAAARKEADERAAATSKENIRLTASLRPPTPEPLVPVLTPGSTAPVLLPRSQAVGMQPWNPAAAKTQSEVEAKEKGKKDVTDSLSDLKRYYDTLKTEGGIKTTGGNPFTNLRAAVANTGPGQGVAGVFGTDAQQARDSIAQARPLLMAAIKNATGMSSQMLNSNAELMFYLQAATDPTKGYEANMEALKRLDKMYGLGNIFADEQPRQQVPAASPAKTYAPSGRNPAPARPTVSNW